MQKSEIKRWVISSIISFLTGFLPAIAINLGKLETGEAITGSVILGVFIAGVRGGIKALVEYLVKKDSSAILE